MSVARPPPPPIPQGREYRTVAFVIETADGGPQIAFFVETSLPPLVGFGIPLASWDWSQVDGEESASGTTWTNQTFELVGTWNGSAFELTERPTPGTRLPAGRARRRAPEECDTNRLATLVDGLLEANVGIYSVGWNGGRVVNIAALVDSPELREALEPLGDAAQVTYDMGPAD